MTVRSRARLLARLSNARHGTAAQDLRDLTESVYGINEIDRQVASSSSSFVFSSVPTLYRDLRVVVVGRSTASADIVAINVQFNGDTGASQYVYQIIQGDAGTISGAGASATNVLAMGVATAANALAGAPGSLVMDIPDYRGTVFHKTAHASSTYLDGSTQATIESRWVTGIWNSTAAITSINVAPSSGNWVDGSTGTLYGLGVG